MNNELKRRLDDLGRLFADHNLDSPRWEAKLLLAHVLECEPGELPFSSRDLSPEQEKRTEALAAARLQGCPLDKLLGEKAFYKYDFKVNEDVLSPRSDTEVLVEAAAAFAAEAEAEWVLDFGTGSGCILLSLLADCPQLHGIGIDVSAAALCVATENGRRLGVEDRVVFHRVSWFSTDWSFLPPGGVDLVVANPPYIPSADIAALAREVREHDPLGALDGGADGLEHYRRLAVVVPQVLRPGGRVFLEVGIGQAEDVREIFTACGLYYLQTLKDLGGIDRCVILQK